MSSTACNDSSRIFRCKLAIYRIFLLTCRSFVKLAEIPRWYLEIVAKSLYLASTRVHHPMDCFADGTQPVPVEGVETSVALRLLAVGRH